MVENVHTVPKKVWRKWTVKQREIFNNLYDELLRVGPDCLFHPITITRNISNEEYDTIAWNSAWLAAHIYRNEFTSEVVTINDADEEVSSKVVL